MRRGACDDQRYVEEMTNRNAPANVVQRLTSTRSFSFVSASMSFMCVWGKELLILYNIFII